MSTPSVSIIMTPWNRTKLLAVTLDTIFAQRYPNLQIIVVEDNPSEASTEMLCLRNGVEYAKRVRRGTDNQWTNPAPLLNKGIRMAKNEILIFQNAECKHEDPNTIERIVTPVAEDHTLSTVPLVRALDEQGRFARWLMHPTDIERAGWISYFCQAVHRDPVVAMAGFDEVRYNGYGFEDDDFEFRLLKSGVHFQYLENALVSHQWHPPYHYTGTEVRSESVFFARRDAIERGEQTVVANEGLDWGNRI